MKTYISKTRNGRVVSFAIALICVATFIFAACGNSSFSIIGKWKSVGDEGWGMAQPGAIITFNGEQCNLFSPADSYAFYDEDGEYQLEVTGLLGSGGSFTVDVVDNDNIELISSGGTQVVLKRVE